MAGVEYVITCICKHGRQLLFLITDFLHTCHKKMVCHQNDENLNGVEGQTCLDMSCCKMSI